MTTFPSDNTHPHRLNTSIPPHHFRNDSPYHGWVGLSETSGLSLSSLSPRPAWTLNKLPFWGSKSPNKDHSGFAETEIGPLLHNPLLMMTASPKSMLSPRQQEYEGNLYPSYLANDTSSGWIGDQALTSFPSLPSVETVEELDEGVNGMLVVAGVTLSLLALSTAVGNALVLHAIRTEKRLQTVSVT